MLEEDDYEEDSEEFKKCFSQQVLCWLNELSVYESSESDVF